VLGKSDGIGFVKFTAFGSQSSAFVDLPDGGLEVNKPDGGALAMRTYGHLRNEHSQQMAQKVRF
jgi:hypothetical protein